ncbi:hypothetical protein Hanom_Chr00s005567g01729371 [Helianthus anomalus]
MQTSLQNLFFFSTRRFHNNFCNFTIISANFILIRDSIECRSYCTAEEYDLQQIAVMDKFSLCSEGREGKNPKFRSSLFTLEERTTI